MVQHALTTHMDFDLDIAKERNERNPVYYAQYAYVRMQSILRKAKEAGLLGTDESPLELSSRSALTHTTEINLMRVLYRFPEVVADITSTKEPQRLAYYAIELAQKIHVFYKNVRVLEADNEDVKLSRLQLVLAARKVLGQTLDLLGIDKPDVM